MKWALMPAAHDYQPSPHVIETERAVLACPGHLWELLLEPCEDVMLHCTRCPAGVDDLYPDGLEMIYYSSDDGTLVIEAGSHNYECDDDTAAVRIPVNAWVLTSRNYWGEYDVEMIIEDREPG